MGHFDYVIHAAGIASPIYYRAQPLKCIDANINGLRNLLDYAVAERKAGRPLKGFLFYSSCEIYGDPAANAIPTPETYRGNVSCTGPRACYDETKRFGETLCVSMRSTKACRSRSRGHSTITARASRSPTGACYPDFAKDVLAGRDIVMLSDGCPKRTFCYATDAITGYYKVLVRGRRRRGLQHRHRQAGDLDGRARPARRRPRPSACSAIRARSCAARPRRPITSSTTQPPLPRHRQGARAARL